MNQASIATPERRASGQYMRHSSGRSLLTETPVSDSMALQYLAGIPSLRQLLTDCLDTPRASARAAQEPIADTTSENVFSVTMRNDTLPMDSSQPEISGLVKSPGMDPVYLTIADELDRRRKPWKWLAGAIEATPQSVNNWRIQRVPPQRYQAVAKAFGWSVERLLSGGAEDAPQPRLTPHALEIAQRLDAIEDHKDFRVAYMTLCDALDRLALPSSQPSSLPAPESTPRPVRRR